MENYIFLPTNNDLIFYHFQYSLVILHNKNIWAAQAENKAWYFFQRRNMIFLFFAPRKLRITLQCTYTDTLKNKKSSSIKTKITAAKNQLCTKKIASKNENIYREILSENVSKRQNFFTQHLLQIIFYSFLVVSFLFLFLFFFWLEKNMI